MRALKVHRVANPAFMTKVGLWFMEQLFSFPPLAHHPPCRCYDNHVLRCGKLVLCLGCTCMAAGLTLATAALGWTYLRSNIEVGWQNAISAIGGGIGLYLPTLFQPFCQRKPYKIVARFLLGVAVVGILAGGLLLPPIDPLGLTARAAFVPAFWLVLKATLRHRSRHTRDPCINCRPAAYPFCQDNRPRVASLLAELRQRADASDAEFVSFATALVSDTDAGTQIEVTSLQPVGVVGHDDSICIGTGRHRIARRQASGTSRPS